MTNAYFLELPIELRSMVIDLLLPERRPFSRCESGSRCQCYIHLDPTFTLTEFRPNSLNQALHARRIDNEFEYLVKLAGVYPELRDEIYRAVAKHTTFIQPTLNPAMIIEFIHSVPQDMTHVIRRLCLTSKLHIEKDDDKDQAIARLYAILYRAKARLPNLQRLYLTVEITIDRAKQEYQRLKTPLRDLVTAIAKHITLFDAIKETYFGVHLDQLISRKFLCACIHKKAEWGSACNLALRCCPVDRSNRQKNCLDRSGLDFDRWGDVVYEFSSKKNEVSGYRAGPNSSYHQ